MPGLARNQPAPSLFEHPRIPFAPRARRRKGFRGLCSAKNTRRLPGFLVLWPREGNDYHRCHHTPSLAGTDVRGALRVKQGEIKSDRRTGLRGTDESRLSGLSRRKPPSVYPYETWGCSCWGTAIKRILSLRQGIPAGGVSGYEKSASHRFFIKKVGFLRDLCELERPKRAGEIKIKVLCPQNRDSFTGHFYR